MKTLSSIFLMVISLTFFKANAQDPVDLLMKSDKAVDKYTNLQYTFQYKERFPGGRYAVGDMDIKVIESPVKKVYVDARLPEKAKLIYIQGQNEGKIKVKKGFTINLDPYAKLLMKDSHHSLVRAGFKRTRDIIMTTYNKRKDDVDDMVQMKGSVIYDGRECWHVVLTDKKYAFVDYVVKKGDNCVKLAERLGIPEMKILELNPSVKGYFELVEGTTIKIPTSYGKVTTMYIDKEYYLALYQKVEDDKGLFCEYKTLKLNVNPKFTDADFQF